MITVIWALAAALGALLTGLIGTGSSLVIMPALVFTLPIELATDPATSIRLAAGTTMAAMAIGAVAAALSQAKGGNVDLNLLRLTAAPYLAGALLGPWLATLMPGIVLRLYLSGLLIIVAVMLLSGRPTTRGHLDYRKKRPELAICLFAISLATSIAGVASGLFTIPYLAARFQLSIRRIMGTSTAAAALYSVFGATSYLVLGLAAKSLPAGALGYIYLPALIPMAAAAIIFAPAGVKLAGFVDDAQLRFGFAVFLLVAGCVIALL